MSGGTSAAFNGRQVEEWLTELHSQCNGFIHISYVTSDKQYKIGRFFPTNQIANATEYVQSLDAQLANGIYARISTLSAVPEGKKRGGESSTLHLPALWADIDIATEGHSHRPCEPSCSKSHAHNFLPLPPDTDVAFDIIDRSGLPEPSCWQFSGGGLYPFWVFDAPFDASDPDGLAEAKALSLHVEAVIKQTSNRLGYHFGTGISNIDRILRLPGTVNRKTENWRQSQMLPGAIARYDWDGFASDAFAVEIEKKKTSVERVLPTRNNRKISPLDAFAESATIADLLEPLGWEHVGGSSPEEWWLRPGSTAPYSAKWNLGGVPTLVVHSSEAGLPTGGGQNLTLGRVLAYLYFDGSESDAARGLLAAAGGNPGAKPELLALPQAVLGHIRDCCEVRQYDGHKVAAPEMPSWYEEIPDIEPEFVLEEESDETADSEVQELSDLLISSVELDLMLEEEDAPYDWLIPGLLERGDRTMVTAAEGAGKSTLIRQIGVQASSGIHPFSLEPIDPIKVLFIDAENTVKQTKRNIRKLRRAAGSKYKPEPGMHITCIPGGLDLLMQEDRDAMAKLIHAVKPELLIMGPIYKMIGGEPKDELPAKAAAMWIDKMRAEVGCAVILEAHSAKGEQGEGKKRPTTPYGASMWMRWPEFGIFIGKDGDIEHWRGQRDEREWPTRLERGGKWPWTVSEETLKSCKKTFDEPEPSRQAYANSIELDTNAKIAYEVISQIPNLNGFTQAKRCVLEVNENIPENSIRQALHKLRNVRSSNAEFEQLTLPGDIRG